MEVWRNIWRNRSSCLVESKITLYKLTINTGVKIIPNMQDIDAGIDFRMTTTTLSPKNII